MGKKSGCHKRKILLFTVPGNSPFVSGRKTSWRHNFEVYPNYLRENFSLEAPEPRERGAFFTLDRCSGTVGGV